MTTFPLKPTSHLWFQHVFYAWEKICPQKKTAGNYFCPLEMDDHRPTKNVPVENDPESSVCWKTQLWFHRVAHPHGVEAQNDDSLNGAPWEKNFRRTRCFCLLTAIFTDSTMGFITMKPTTISENMFKELPLIFDFVEVLGKKWCTKIHVKQLPMISFLAFLNDLFWSFCRSQWDFWWILEIHCCGGFAALETSIECHPGKHLERA